MALTKVKNIVASLSASDVGAISTSLLGANSGVATLGADGKLAPSQLPALAVSEVFTVSSQAAMLALSSASTGDIAIRTDIQTSFILSTTDYSTLANWIQVLTPSGTATSAAQLTTARSISATGDGAWSVSFNGTADVSSTLTLASSGVTAGTYNNSATTVTPFTVDAKGRVTGTGTAVTIAPAFSSITGKPTTLSGYGISDAQALDATLTAMAGVTTAADRVIYFTAADTAAVMPVTAVARTLLDDTTTAAMLTTLGASPLVSPAFTGTPTAPTATAGTNTTQIATTAFVTSATSAARPVYGVTTVSVAGTTQTSPASITAPLLLAIDGVIQTLTTAYTIVGTTLTLSESVPVGTEIFVLGYVS